MLTWASGLFGVLGDIKYDPHFAAHGIEFIATIENPYGAGGLRLQAVAIPEASTALVSLFLAVLLCLARPWRDIIAYASPDGQCSSDAEMRRCH